jgi:hypothetical protein
MSILLTKSIRVKITQLLLTATLVLGFQTLSHLAMSMPITNYHPTFIPVQNQTGDLQIVIRLFDQQNKLYALLVDPYSLKTSMDEFTKLYQRRPQSLDQKKPGYFSWQEIAHTPYMKLIQHCTKAPFSNQNGGIKHALTQPQGIFLTVDMCPSTKPFEKSFFQKLVSLSSATEPFEVGVSITGLWMLGHPQEFAWLCREVQQGRLNITWINHTLSHLYYPDISLENNFMCFSPIAMAEPEKQVFIQERLQEEILFTERLLLENDQLPSVFFRFPGLIADQGLANRLGNLGLIPLGTDAWLAKGETPQPGSIILVHGNGNETPGIKKVMTLLSNRSLKWLPLSHLGRLED